MKRDLRIDLVKIICIIQVLGYHFYSKWFDVGFLVIPDSFLQNWNSIFIFKYSFVSLLSVFFYYGYYAVNVFLIISGYLLTKSYVKHGYFDYIKALKGLYIPFYLSVFVGVGFWFIRNIIFLSLSADPLFQVKDLLLVFIPLYPFYDIELLQLFNGDYWFVVLILQAYACFPIIYWFIRKTRFVGFVSLISLTVLVRYYLIFWNDSVPMGVLYPTENGYYYFSYLPARLAEFAFGIWLAISYSHAELYKRMFRYKYVMILVLFASLVLHSYSWFWLISDFWVGVGYLSVLLVMAYLINSFFPSALLQKLSNSVYDIYLYNSYLLNYLWLPFIYSNKISFAYGLLGFIFFGICTGFVIRQLRIKLLPQFLSVR